MEEILALVGEIAEARVPHVIFDAPSGSVLDDFEEVLAYAARRGLDAQIEIPSSPNPIVTITAFGDVCAGATIVGSVRLHRLPALLRRLDSGERPRERRNHRPTTSISG